MAEPGKYPIKQYDNLGRLIYIDHNGVERTLYRYWHDTRMVKIIYRYLGMDMTFDAYTQDGTKIISYVWGRLEVTLPGLKVHNGRIASFGVHPTVMADWKARIKRLKAQKKFR